MEWQTVSPNYVKSQTSESRVFWCYFSVFLVGGWLLDYMEFRVLMPVISLLLAINLASIYFVAQNSFLGLIVSVWLIYLLGFAHFTTIPAQVFSARATVFLIYIFRR